MHFVYSGGDGFLFRSTIKSGDIVNLLMSSEAISSRLKVYLNELGMNEGETLVASGRAAR